MKLLDGIQRVKVPPGQVQAYVVAPTLLNSGLLAMTQVSHRLIILLLPSDIQGLGSLVLRDFDSGIRGECGQRLAVVVGSKSNYFIGNDPKKWRANVPNYAKQSLYCLIRLCRRCSTRVREGGRFQR